MYQQSGFKCVNCGYYNTSADCARSKNEYPSDPSLGFPAPNQMYPGAQHGYPKPQNEYPRSQREYPEAHHEYPRSQREYPEADHGYPRSKHEYPEAHHEYPGSQHVYPEADHGYPRSQHEYPEAHRESPVAQREFSGTHHEYPRSQHEYPEAHHGYPRSQHDYPEAHLENPVVHREFSGVQPEYPRPQNKYPYPHPQHNTSTSIPFHMPMSGQATPYPSTNPYSTSNQLDSSHKSSEVVRNIPTVFAAGNIDLERDAEILRNAMKGFGTNEDAIISVLTRRSTNQRIEIAREFKSMFGRDLIEDLESELSGNFKKLAVALMTPWDEFLAKEIQHAVDNLGTNEDTLIEIICSVSNSQILKISESYLNLFGHTLEEDIRDDTSGSLKHLLVSLSMGNRNEDYYVDEHSAYEDAQMLLSAGNLIFGTDESVFNQILCKRSFCHLRSVFKKYQEISGDSIKKAIRSEFSGDIQKALLAIVRCVLNRPMFFAKQFNKAIKGFGTNDRKLIRLVVSRCEIDLGNIKEAYYEKYSRSLEEDIDDDTSGDYKKCLIALLG